MSAKAKHEFLEQSEEEGTVGNVPKSLQNLLSQGATDSVSSSIPVSKTVRPNPGFCVKTSTQKGDKVFINICSSEQVPSPKEISDEQLKSLLESGDATQFRVPLSLGEAHTETDNVGKDCSVYDVIISKSFLETVQKRPLMKDFLLTIVVEGLEDKYSLSLNRECKILKKRTFFGSLLEQSVRQKPKPFIMEVEDKKKGPLISEVEAIGSVPEPKYTIIREPAEGEMPEFLVMEVQLPKITSAKTLTLEVGEDRLSLSAHPRLYCLDLDLPYTVDNEETGAQFNRDSKVLSVTLTVTGRAPV